MRRLPLSVPVDQDGRSVAEPVDPERDPEIAPPLQLDDMGSKPGLSRRDADGCAYRCLAHTTLAGNDQDSRCR